ncbi:UNVERIFIED_CONTAM: hypothetical protein GTU68_017198, partial [Idotea baltica]|nr:hypothetical protein [Idotea baltica]
SSGSNVNQGFAPAGPPSANPTSCSEGEVLNVDGSCARPEVSRNIFVYTAPERPFQQQANPIQAPKPKLNYNIVFVRTPEGIDGQEPVVVPPPQQKTIVYVLNKDSEDQGPQMIEVPAPVAHKPEVFYVNYREGENPQLPIGVDLQSALSSAINQQGQSVRGGEVEGGNLGFFTGEVSVEGSRGFVSNDTIRRFISDQGTVEGSGEVSVELESLVGTGGFVSDFNGGSFVTIGESVEGIVETPTQERIKGNVELVQSKDKLGIQSTPPRLYKTPLEESGAFVADEESAGKNGGFQSNTIGGFLSGQESVEESGGISVGLGSVGGSGIFISDDNVRSFDTSRGSVREREEIFTQGGTQGDSEGLLLSRDEQGVKSPPSNLYKTPHVGSGGFVSEQESASENKGFQSNDPSEGFVSGQGSVNGSGRISVGMGSVGSGEIISDDNVRSFDTSVGSTGEIEATIIQGGTQGGSEGLVQSRDKQGVRSPPSSLYKTPQKGSGGFDAEEGSASDNIGFQSNAINKGYVSGHESVNGSEAASVGIGSVGVSGEFLSDDNVTSYVTGEGLVGGNEEPLTQGRTQEGSEVLLQNTNEQGIQSLPSSLYQTPLDKNREFVAEKGSAIENVGFQLNTTSEGFVLDQESVEGSGRITVGVGLAVESGGFVSDDNDTSEGLVGETEESVTHVGAQGGIEELVQIRDEQGIQSPSSLYQTPLDKNRGFVAEKGSAIKNVKFQSNTTSGGFVSDEGSEKESGVVSVGVGLVDESVGFVSDNSGDGDSCPAGRMQ